MIQELKQFCKVDTDTAKKGRKEMAGVSGRGLRQAVE
jgi:hypothetical protein